METVDICKFKYIILNEKFIPLLNKAPIITYKIDHMPTYCIGVFLDNDITDIDSMYNMINNNDCVQYYNRYFTLDHLFVICLITKLNLDNKELKYAISESKSIPFNFAQDMYTYYIEHNREQVIRALYITMAIKNNIDKQINFNDFILPSNLFDALNSINLQFKF
jgi:hypothetical protein